MTSVEPSVPLILPMVNCSPAVAGLVLPTAARTTTAGDLAVEKANGAGLQPTMETVVGLPAATTLNAHLPVPEVQPAARVIAVLAAAVAE